MAYTQNDSPFLKVRKTYDVCYEDLTTNQEQETKKLLEYCELDWDENCLNFHKNKRAVKTASSLQVRDKMYQGSSEAWKKYEAHIQPLIDGLKPLLKKIIKLVNYSI